jgi:glycerol dehydrogenase-like iron-containing ADH family enzyme
MNVWPLPCITFRALSSVQESRPVALVTSPAAWALARPLLQLPVVVQAEPTEATQEFCVYLASQMPSAVEAIYAVGDGLTLDVARMVAHQARRPLIIVPTLLSTDRAFAPDAALSADGKTQLVATGPADEVIVDLDTLRMGPAHHRAAAIVDVIAIVTALMDWEYAEQKQQNGAETHYLPWAAGAAAALAGQALKIAAPVGQGDTGAFKTLIDLLCMMIQLNNLLGHRRASQGIAHVFAEAVLPNATVVELSHAERVAPGILLAAALYKKNTAGLRTALEAAGVRLTQLKPEDIRTTFTALPDYAREHGKPYSILNDIPAGSNDLAEALARSTLMP